MSASRKWLLVTLAAVGVFLSAAALTAYLIPPRAPVVPNRPSTRPETNPTGAYSIQISIDDHGFGDVVIGTEGENCELLQREADAYRTCLIGTNLIPSIIGGEAYGQLNFRHTPALDALVWRARANGDPNVCRAGGLEDNFLAVCESDAVSGDYEYSAGSVRVHVPIGGA